MAGFAAPDTLRGRYMALATRHGAENVLTAHRNAALLDDSFNVGAYLMRNGDVAHAVDNPCEAVFHFLEYGIDEGRFAVPETWEPGFVRQYHGLDLPPDHSALRANQCLRAAGFGPDQALLCEEHLWVALGVHGALFTHLFEHEFYIVAAEAAGHPVPGTDRLAAIRHFCGIGLSEGIPPHPEHVFDPAFYLDALALARGTAPASHAPAVLRAHWARIGVSLGAHANPRAWFRMACGLPLPEGVFLALPAVRAASVDLRAGASMAETLHHLATTPMPGAGALDPAAPGVAGFLVDLARHRRSAGDAAAAEALLQRVIDHAPDHPHAALELADLIHAQNRIDSEIRLRRVVPARFDVGANGITLAERLVTQGQFRDALDVCADLPDTVFADVALRRRRRNIARAIFDTLWADLSGRIETMPVSEIQSLLADALALYTPPFTAPPRSASIRRVAVFASDDLYQCKLYRADQKIDQLRAAGYEADLFLQDLDLDRLRGRLDLYDAIIFMRTPGFPAIVDLIVDAAQQGVVTFYDCDDLIFDAGLFPPPLSTYAGGISAAEHAAIACGVPLFRHAMSLCDHAIASTPTLRDEMAAIVRSGRAFLHRNALGAAHLRVIDREEGRRAEPPGEKLVIQFGSGTRAHKAEFAEILEPALAEVLALRPGKVEIRIIGDVPAFGHLDPSHPDVHVMHPIWDFDSYCAAVAQADINLSVLAPSLLTDAKSEIKWMEAAMFAIPSVVSPTATHRDVVEDGVTGMLAADTAGFVSAILSLVDDPSLRQRIGEAARQRVLRDYALPAMAASWTGIFDTVRPAAARSKARLLIVNVFYPPQDIGGATRVVQDNVADLLSLYGDHYEIDVIATLEGGTRPHHVDCYARDGVRVWTITARDAIDTMQVSDHRMADVFDRLLTRIAPDLVHVHCIQRLTASVVDTMRRRHVPYVVTLHDGWWISPHQFIVARDGRPETYDYRPEAAALLPERARITQRALEGAAAVLAVSEAFAEVHRKAGLETVEVVENGVSTLPERRLHPGPEGRVRLGLIGGMSRHKGYALLRAALYARRFENLDLVVADHGMATGRTREEVWNGTPVLFLPRTPLSEVGTVYGRIDVLLAPSVWPESYGLVTREALALGLWVVASDRGAVGQDVVEGENGFVVDVSDHHALVDVLGRIDADPERYRAPPAHRPTLRRATEQAQALHEVYQRILAPSGAGPGEGACPA